MSPVGYQARLWAMGFLLIRTNISIQHQYWSDYWNIHDKIINIGATTEISMIRFVFGYLMLGQPSFNVISSNYPSSVGKGWLNWDSKGVVFNSSVQYPCIEIYFVDSE